MGNNYEIQMDSTADYFHKQMMQVVIYVIHLFLVCLRKQKGHLDCHTDY